MLFRALPALFFSVLSLTYFHFSEENNNVVAEALEKQNTTQLGGVLPTYAMKSHAVNVPKVVDQVLQDVKIADIDAIAVTTRPGLNGSLIIGRNYAQYLCYKFKKRECLLFKLNSFIKTNSF